ncbi:uncharacterized protein LOC106642088 [Copidosoma floridanum]|uniref:uncharacterized protein LOC106642088 n=1 Tax=Copidosoma floridanum TaxID=29053 RepID=UPI0006C9A6AF|nr:uncharacterized protein LOC106642088 [Copidosoma floridanum]
MSKSRNIVCDARCQQFQREMAKKEEQLRNQWFIKNRKRLYENLGEPRFAEKLKSLEQKRKKEVATVAAPRSQQVRGSKTKPALPPWRPSEQDTGLMRPIKPDVEGIIYAAQDASFTSKLKYLRERYKSKPEDRFYYPYCSSWIFGWRLKDYPETKISEYGVRSIIQSSFYRKSASSLQRDPDWYRMCQTGDPKNFNEILTY